jgi:alpha-N-arabinofuranosidase
LVEEVYNFEDALAAGGALSVLMNNADRVKAACLAQLVNAIGAIMTEPGGPAWRQTIFHPFALAARYARGVVLRPVLRAPVRQARDGTAMPDLVASATFDAAHGRTAVFALNRHLTEEQDLAVEFRGSQVPQDIVAAFELHHRDLQAVNGRSAPQEVAPVPHPRVRMEQGAMRARLQPASWNVFVLGDRA